MGQDSQMGFAFANLGGKKVAAAFDGGALTTDAREYAYQPLHIYDGMSGGLITTVLRPGCRAKGVVDFVKILRRVVARLRAAWPQVDILVRGDSHFSAPEVHDFGQAQGLWFVLGQSPNAVLNKLIAPTLAQAQALFDDR